MAFRPGQSDGETTDDASSSGSDGEDTWPIEGATGPPGAFNITGNWEGGLRAEIANVTTNHTLMRRTPHGLEDLVLDLRKIADASRGTFGWSYDPRRSMPATKLNIQCGRYFSKMNMALYSSGSVVQTGCQSPEQARLAAHIFARTTLRLLGVDVVVTNFRVDNMVAVVNFDGDDGSLDLSALNQHLGARCDYQDPLDPINANKTTYPAAIIHSRVNARPDHRGESENIKILMYDTAHAVMMGVTSRASIAAVVAEVAGIVARVKGLRGTVGLQTRTVPSDLVLHMERIRNANAAIRLRIGRS
jgi:Transcription factor TFIID (or TATA-binding protein, TBP)